MIVILGPTAVGKTKASIELAKRIKGEIVSADSMQVYRGMDIGTAKPTLEERQGIPHHLIDIKEPDEPWTVSDFVKEAGRLSNEIAQRGKIPMIVGGTGLYLWTLLEGYAFPIAPANKEIRQRLEKDPLSTLYSRLSTIDPLAAQKIHPNDKKRIIRALEAFELTGKPISVLQQEGRKKKTKEKESKDILIGLTLSRETLYQRIEERVDQMIEKGLIEEVKGLLAKGFSKELPSFQALGYKEVAEYLAGKWSKEEILKELKKRTRHFARRQMTWFKRFKAVKWFDPVDTQAILDYINSI
jgi:tRNA dimethylallyltransferase